MRCMCGSNLEKFPVHDARGIFCCYACDECEDAKRQRYRLEVFEDPSYFCDEEIEAE